MMRQSLTFVQVGPGFTRSPRAAKNGVESFWSSIAAGSRPAARARSRVVGSISQPAGSVASPRPPSVPSVSALMPLMRVLEQGGKFIQCIKHGCEMMGQYAGPPRPPLKGLNKDDKRQLEQTVRVLKTTIAQIVAE